MCLGAARVLAGRRPGTVSCTRTFEGMIGGTEAAGTTRLVQAVAAQYRQRADHDEYGDGERQHHLPRGHNRTFGAHMFTMRSNNGANGRADKGRRPPGTEF
jgi:hypothetical protein